jgi:quinone-modifying oxidoreductase subunit QmoC
MHKIDPSFKKEVAKYGAGNWNECFHCGNCTAICSLSEDEHLFPRSTIRNLQLGLKSKIHRNVDPWLCYYCGDCSDTCMRDANPGELMMVLRRYLTSVYDWTGISGRLYKSFKAHLSVVIILFLLVLGAFALFHGEVITENVMLNEFAPVGFISTIDHLFLGILGIFLLSNIVNMFLKVISADKNVHIPFYLYILKMGEGLIHFFTQRQLLKCKKIGYWIGHLYLMLSYIGMFVIIIFFLDSFQINGSEWQKLSIPGYIITAGLLIPSLIFIIGRIRRRIQVFKFSHHSDWIFVILFLLALSGILIHIFRINQMPLATYVTYALHLAFEVPMVVTFVAFSKWSHLAYRPLALYFSSVKKAASKLSVKTQVIPSTI